MRYVQVHIQVKPEAVAAFIRASAENAAASRHEAGIVQFDVLQSADEPTRFILFEVYHSAEAQAEHKTTPHFARWQAAVRDLIRAPGRAEIYHQPAP